MTDNEITEMIEDAADEYYRKNYKQTVKVLKDVLRERSRQDEKWGEQTKTKDAWLTAIGEEFGEACKAVIDEQSQDYVKELIHTAATCVCAIEDLLRQHRKNKEIK